MDRLLGTDHEDPDTDGDGIWDGAETFDGTDPLDDEDYLANGNDFYIDCEDPFEDTKNHFAEKAICILYDEGVVKGRSSNSFEPDSKITRAEFLKIALLNAGHNVEENNELEYEDVDEDDWFHSYVTYGTEIGVVEGYDDGTFRPNQEINRAEAMVIMMRVAELAKEDASGESSEFSDVEADAWFAWAVSLASENGISEGYEDGTFRPENSITRGEVSVIARRIWYVFHQE